MYQNYFLIIAENQLLLDKLVLASVVEIMIRGGKY